MFFFFFKQKTAYEMRISDWSSDVCSSDLKGLVDRERSGRAFAYRPVLSREERAALRMGEVLATAGDHSAALSRFVEALPERERAQLRDALRAASGGS